MRPRPHKKGHDLRRGPARICKSEPNVTNMDARSPLERVLYGDPPRNGAICNPHIVCHASTTFTTPEHHLFPESDERRVLVVYVFRWGRVVFPGAGALVRVRCRRIEIMIFLRKIKVFGLGEGLASPWPGPRASPWLGPMAQGSSPIKGAIWDEKLPPEACWFY